MRAVMVIVRKPTRATLRKTLQSEMPSSEQQRLLRNSETLYAASSSLSLSWPLPHFQKTAADSCTGNMVEKVGAVNPSYA